MVAEATLEGEEGRRFIPMMTHSLSEGTLFFFGLLLLDHILEKGHAEVVDVACTRLGHAGSSRENQRGKGREKEKGKRRTPKETSGRRSFRKGEDPWIKGVGPEARRKSEETDRV